MRKAIRTAALLLIASLYCFAISFFSSGNLLSVNSSKSRSSSERDYYSVVSPTLVCHTNQTENILDTIQQHSSSFRTNLVDDFLSAWRIREQLQPARIASCIDRSKPRDLGFDSTSIIYPFHYFL